MDTIQFKEANCKNCYKCIRSCPVKAISFRNDQAQILDRACILCGKCLRVCPQNAKSVNSEIDNVKLLLKRKLKVYVSLAPSFASAFNVRDERHIYGLLKKLGFTHTEETALGALRVTYEYHKLLLKREMKNLISTACPTINTLVEKYYPELINQLAPVVSPMIAHAKMMKEMYGPRIKIVFIGPCLAKKEEYKDDQNNNLVDSVITFEEFDQWIKEEGLSFDDYEDEDDDKNLHNINTRFYPAPGGVIKALGATKKYKYKFLKFDGIERCMDILNQIKNENVKGYFFEMNSCEGGCLGGPCMNENCGGFIEKREKLITYIGNSITDKENTLIYNDRIDMSKVFVNKSDLYKLPTEDEIIKILRKIGKYSKDDELNCGACGYQSCRDKAIAVYNNKADLHMCLPYMRERAESISNVITNSSPNAIFAVTDDMMIQEANASAKKFFNLHGLELSNKNIMDILNCNSINNVLETKIDLYNEKYSYEDYGIVVEQSIMYLKENHMVVIIMKDITNDEEKRQKSNVVRSETIDIAQNVIDKQMRVAQEIASLLGETTAETKVALTKLKKSIETEIGDK